MFDVTLEESFKAVRPWLNNVQVGQSAPMMQYVTSHMGRFIKFLLFYLLPWLDFLLLFLTFEAFVLY